MVVFHPPKGVKGGKGAKVGKALTGKGVQVKRELDTGHAVAKKAKGGKPANGDSVKVGEVRYDSATAAQAALSLDGSDLGGSQITVAMDEKSKDMTKLIITNIAAGVMWQELKDHFAQCGTVAFADVKSGAPKTAEIRMETPEEAQQAIAILNGTAVGDGIITVKAHPTSKDGTKLIVNGVSHELAWQDLKDQFAQAGTVAFCDIVNDKLPAGVQLEGEVRFDDPANTQEALTSLNGSFIGDTQIFLEIDAKSVDGSKLIVRGLTPSTEWQELKDHFAPIGTVAFAQIHTKGFGKGMTKGFDPRKGGFGAFGGFGGAVFPGKGGKAPKGGGKAVGGKAGEVRFDTPMQAQMAIAMLNGSYLNGGYIQVDWDWKSIDGTKLWVAGIPPGTGWQDLKDHFASAGRVAFADIKPAGKGK